MSNGPFYPEGRYLCEVTSQAMGKAGTGNPQFMLRFKVLEGVNVSAPAAQYERTFYRTITEKTMEYFVEDLQALGFTRDSFKYLDPSTPNYHSFRGQEIEMFCKHEAAQDGSGLREKWGIARAGGSELKANNPLDAKGLRDLDNLYGKQLKKLPSAVPMASAQSAPVPAGGNWEAKDEDVF